VRSLAELIFLPRPREIAVAPGFFAPGAAGRISIFGDVPADRGIGPQGYRLTIAPSGVEIAASDAAGAFYGAVTFAQIFRQCGNAMPCGSILDSPDFPVRGVMLDISRDKVPTMETLFALVELFAGLKINHLQLYTEHTFAYARHRDVWQEASPMTGTEVRRLDAFCRERFIELAPNQNSFGHLHRWLSLPAYRGLAECPDGFAWPWGGRSAEPFSLDPGNPASLDLLAGLFGELLPCFSSRLFNVGCDETFDLGQGRSRKLCEERGKGRVYLDFLLKIHALVAVHGRTMLYWDDIVMQHPELVGELPRDAVALEWGYEADHPFDEHGARLRAAGVPWWVCPGTSSWNSIAGRTDNCLENIRAAARAGIDHGAAGFLNTDWGDNGHWQALPVSFLGFAAGAALSWCLAASSESDFTRELDAHVFRDSAGIMGALAHDLGNAYLRAGERIHNRSPLFDLLLEPESGKASKLPPAERLAETRRWVQGVSARLDGARMDRPDARLIRDEYDLTARMLLFACDYGLAPAAAATREQLESILPEYERLWMLRNRAGGLADSMARLKRIVT
jgi:hexosaminidase